MNMTEAEVKSRIMARMGAGRRVLEFSVQRTSGEPDSLTEAVQQALDLFNQYIFREVLAYIPSTSAAQMVVKFGEDAESPDELDDELLRVVNVSFTRPAVVNQSNDDPFLLMGRTYGAGYRRGGYGQMAPAGRDGLGDLMFYKQYREAQERATSQEPDWLWDDNNRQLALYMPGGPYEVTYTKAYHHTLATLPNNYASFFMKAVEGYARLILSDIRGKFGSQIPGPTGGASTDADQLRDRGQRLVSEVEETLRKLPLQAGIEFG